MEIKYWNETFGKKTIKYFIGIYDNETLIGKIKFGFIYDVLDIFDSLIVTEIIIKNYPNNKTIYIDTIEIIDEYRNMGYANILMEEYIKYFNEQKTHFQTTLTVCPFQKGIKRKLSVEILQKFYEKFGFRLVNEKKKNNIMLLKK